MNDLLTTKQLQDLLKIDRTTVYRMLKDGRLAGVKVGNQWRFPRADVEAQLMGDSFTGAEVTPQTDSPVFSTEVIPLNCIQSIQNMFAEMAGVGSVTTAPDGEPLTEISNCCHFCNLILSSESGRQACIASWRKLAKQSEYRPNFVNCHAGLQYARARIEMNGQLEAMIIAGQFYAQPPDTGEEEARVQHLANKHGLDAQELAEAVQNLPVLDQHKQARIGTWLESVAHTFEEIGHERADMMNRLRNIAEMSKF